MALWDKLAQSLGLKGKQAEALAPAPSANPSQSFQAGKDPVSYELNEQKEMFTAFYVHKMSQGQATVRDKNLDPALLANAQKAAEIHMDSLYPSSETINRDRMDLGEMDAKLDNSLRDYANEKRVLEAEAREESCLQAVDMATSQNKGAQVDAGYAALMRETGQMQQRIKDETGMTLTFDENDIRAIHDFEDQCKERIHNAIEGTNPNLADIMTQTALRGTMGKSIEDARTHNQDMDKAYAKDLGAEMEHVHMGAALDARRQVLAMEDAEKGDRDALLRDELQMSTLSL